MSEFCDTALDHDFRHLLEVLNMMTLSYIVEHQDVPARLDYSERNDQMRYPDGAYIGKDYHLLRLALVSEVTPRVNKKYCTVTPASQ